ncbi:cysteine--tRNA ligase [Aliishimia ponticola]|uniref:Cysteine--tRNA ligase n=1 Tax=Aliishimia ponticola TaxID=2499833 RepID=A0A4S4NGY9_9RHOB|nr:cysteine--tRNA ligase [Aliishimia ponticola]THH38899.1 cysteine--tRNA ligase [Aliishimia ponticola]
MTEIKLYNTASRSKEVFTPLDPKNVRMYVCGPTVYDRAHLGNARPVLVFDVLYRLLRHVYGPDHVTYVRNFTDVDDKINATALARKEAGAKGTLEELIAERAEETIGWYLTDMGALGALEPNEMPRATEFIGQMIQMIERLIADGFAYAKDGHVLFRVRKYDAYGKLSGRSVDDMIAGARVEVAPYKEDPMDFVLWKPSDDALPGWDSPWGRGRPGWHIECSAMADELLWEKPVREGRLSAEAMQKPHVFDIHGGGLDLQFPHHEDEIAQSCCANQTDEMAQIWMHNEMLQVEGKKMSKSLGNFFTVRDLLDDGVPPEVIRFVMLSTHYRKPMDWTEKKRQEAEMRLTAYFKATENVEAAQSVPQKLVDALANDLNTHLALSELVHLHNNSMLPELKSGLRFLGFPDAEDVEWFRGGTKMAALSNLSDHSTLLLELLSRWQEFRDKKEYAAADELKQKLEATGLKLSVGVAGPEAEPTGDFDPAKLEALK